jgi:hypothetical protein
MATQDCYKHCEKKAVTDKHETVERVEAVYAGREVPAMIERVENTKMLITSCLVSWHVMLHLPMWVIKSECSIHVDSLQQRQLVLMTLQAPCVVISLGAH